MYKRFEDVERFLKKPSKRRRRRAARQLREHSDQIKRRVRARIEALIENNDGGKGCLEDLRFEDLQFAIPDDE